VTGEDRDNETRGDIMAHAEERVLRPGEWLETGQYLQSSNGQFTAFLNDDGNFHLRRRDGSHFWESWWTDKYKSWAANNTGLGPDPRSNIAIMEVGQFKVYQSVNYSEIRNCPDRVSWSARATSGDGGNGIELGDDGRLRIRSTNGFADCVTPAPLADMSPIKHIFVLMLENRSFDHMFGGLGLRGPDAVTGKHREADAKRGAPGRAKEEIVGVSLVLGPDDKKVPKDPLHEFPDVVEQLCGKGKKYPSGGDYPPINNSGFADNFATVAGEAERDDVMRSYDRDQIPALATLAEDFAVCDSWFSSMPGPTTSNRFFVAAATAGGLDHTSYPDEVKAWAGVKPGVGPLSPLPNPLTDPNAGFKFANGTIFSRLEGANPRRTWNIYVEMKKRPLFHPGKTSLGVGALLSGASLFSALAGDPIHAVQFVSGVNIDKVMNSSVLLSGIDIAKLKPYSDFRSDLQNGIAADFTFIEPDYGGLLDSTFRGGNSQHPQDGVKGGDRLIASVYHAIRNSPLWKTSMLIIYVG
jgi:phospholipase C